MNPKPETIDSTAASKLLKRYAFLRQIRLFKPVIDLGALVISQDDHCISITFGKVKIFWFL